MLYSFLACRKSKLKTRIRRISKAVYLSYFHYKKTVLLANCQFSVAENLIPPAKLQKCQYSPLWHIFRQ